MIIILKLTPYIKKIKLFLMDWLHERRIFSLNIWSEILPYGGEVVINI